MEFLPHMRKAQDPSKQAVATQRKSQDSEGGGRGSVITIRMSFLANGTDLSRDGEWEETAGTAEAEMTLSFSRTWETGPTKKQGSGWEVALPKPRASLGLTLPMGKMFCFLISCLYSWRPSYSLFWGNCALGRLLHAPLATVAHRDEADHRWRPDVLPGCGFFLGL